MHLGSGRDRGPDTQGRLTEIATGRAIVQQGLAATCKDLESEDETKDARSAKVWRMSLYER
jgi:hypothetical protein